MSEQVASIPAPAIVTAGPSKMAASAPCELVTGAKITRGPSPVFGIAARYYVDPESVPRFRYGSGQGAAA